MSVVGYTVETADHFVSG